ncbi:MULTISPECIES: uracil phosphoribosyltransferase [Helcococcus]|uniref:Uracil phosphoribosyltransferase n=1 Tax=Helcococcus bovis TaxID=3153252 RepID=A0ABW9F826_9FIRM
MSKLTVLEHPLIKHKLSIIRDVNTGTNEFRKVVTEISQLMCYEVCRDLELEEFELQTPLEKTTAYRLSGKKLGLVPILRAGLGMVDGMLMLLPSAKVGHIGMYRDHDTLKPVPYYAKLPADVEERDIFVLDPMLATGGSANDAITELKNQGCKSIRLINIVAAPEGVKAIQEAHPDVDIYVASLDRELNKDAYILPGLGDAGDRLFGTK